MVRDVAQRTRLFDLDTAIQRVNLDTPAHAAAVPLTGVYHNLAAALCRSARCRA